MKGTKLFFVLLFTTSFCFAQINPGARQVALAHSDISISNDVFSLFNNPSGLANISSRQAGIYYSPSPFSVNELSNAYGAYVEPLSFGSVAAGFMIYGFELYKETRLSLGYGKKIGNNFSVGLTAIYKNISIQNYGNNGFILFNAGAIAKISKSINLGFALENFTRTSAADEDNQFPVVLSSGLSYNVIEDLQTFFAIRKELNYAPSLRFGAEYNLLKYLQLRFGAGNEPSNYSGGIGIIYDLFQFDYAVLSHQDLGLTHQFGLIVRFGN